MWAASTLRRRRKQIRKGSPVLSRTSTLIWRVKVLPTRPTAFDLEANRLLIQHNSFPSQETTTPPPGKTRFHLRQRATTRRAFQIHWQGHKCCCCWQPLCARRAYLLSRATHMANMAGTRGKEPPSSLSEHRSTTYGQCPSGTLRIMEQNQSIDVTQPRTPADSIGGKANCYGCRRLNRLRLLQRHKPANGQRRDRCYKDKSQGTSCHVIKSCLNLLQHQNRAVHAQHIVPSSLTRSSGCFV
jgi:hypothetical protein